MTPNKKQELKIEVPESVADGSYSNFSIISHSGAEFIIDFARITPGVPKAKVQSRIIMTPIHAKTLLKTLQDNIAKFEKNFGQIPEFRNQNSVGELKISKNSLPN